MATSNQYDVKVAEQAFEDAKTVLAEKELELKVVEKQLKISAATSVLTKAELETITKNDLSINDLPADRKAVLLNQYEKLTASTPAYTALQKSINGAQTAVKSTALDVNAAVNGQRVTQGKTGKAVSPAIDPAAKQTPLTVRSPGTSRTTNTLTGTRQTTSRTTNTLTGTRQPSVPGASNSDILNNPTGLILGATALTAITSNPTLISNIGNGISRIFNNAGDILPVSSNVPSAPTRVDPTSVPAPAAVPPAGETTAAAAPVAGDEALAAAQAAQEVADLQIAAGSSTPVDIQTDGLLEQQQAILQAQEAADLQIAAESATPVDPITESLLYEQELTRQAIADEELNDRLDRAANVPLTDQEADQQAQDVADLRVAAESANPVSPLDTGYVSDAEQIARMPPADATIASGVTTAAKNRAQGQSTNQTRVNQPAAADWRVRISLAQNSTYLYNAPSNQDGSGGPGILAPLATTNGVIFPYTPSIETSYSATYGTTPLTHSNYKGQFYQNSSVGDVTIRGTFTAQDTREASYLLAVIHFFRSVTKMFYGQDSEAGTPPPLVYLSGLGQYQFNNHPCVVTNFSYNMPNEVDYIRANGFNNIGLNMSNRRNQSSGPGPGGSLGTVVAIIGRLKNAGLKPGATAEVPNSSTVNQNVTNQNSINSTYVPTKMEISVTLAPIQTRSQVSQQFSLKNFANGDLLKGGFW